MVPTSALPFELVVDTYVILECPGARWILFLAVSAFLVPFLNPRKPPLTVLVAPRSPRRPYPYPIPLVHTPRFPRSILSKV